MRCAAHPLGTDAARDRRDRRRPCSASSCCAPRSAALASSTCSWAIPCPASADGARRVTVTRRRLRVTGTVQGVGFRPFVYRHAVDLGLDRVGAQRQRGRADRRRGRGGRHRSPAPATRRRSPAAGAGHERHRRGRGRRCRLGSAVPPGSRSSSRTTPGPCRPGERRHGHVRRLPGRGRSTRATVATATRSRTAPTAGRATRSSAAFPMTGPRRPWPASRCVRPASASTTIPGIGVSTPNRMHARCAGPSSGGSICSRGSSPLATTRCAPRSKRCSPGRSSASKASVATTSLSTPPTRMRSRELRRRKSRDDKPFAVMAADGEAAAALVEVDDATVQRADLAPPADRARASATRQRGGGCGGTRVARARGDAAVHAVASLVARRRRAAAGDDERQPQRRADRTRGRRRGNSSRVARRRSAVAQPADPHPVRRLGGPGRGWEIAGPASVARSRTGTAGVAVRARGIDPRASVRSSSRRSR